MATIQIAPVTCSCSSRPTRAPTYSQESLNLFPNDPRSSHAIVWMYGQRVPIVVWVPAAVEAQDHEERVTLADLASTTARLMGFDAFAAADGTTLPGITSPLHRPRVIVTLVIVLGEGAFDAVRSPRWLIQLPAVTGGWTTRPSSKINVGLASTPGSSSGLRS